MALAGFSGISESEFIEDWGATVKPSGDLYFFADLASLPLSRIWTIYEHIEDREEGGHYIHWCAMPGIVPSMALGYLITQKNWDGDTPNAIWFLDEDEAAAIEREVLENE